MQLSLCGVKHRAPLKHFTSQSAATCQRETSLNSELTGQPAPASYVACVVFLTEERERDRERRGEKQTDR